ncbi:MAG TPA: GNAT family N-acetyltransferase [Candidatus Dormibacteraeota bacterium]|nr:GNAT family N-acetyltransferase [Candidatus Dormibacteraeota bacterium]
MIRDGDVALRPMRDDDADRARYVEWRNRPHVREWWDPDDPPMTLAQVEAEHGPSLKGSGPDRLFIIEVDSVPVGFVQSYPWSAYAGELADLGLTVPDGAWGLDIFIGDEAHVGRGVGTRVVRMLGDHLFATEDASALAFGVDLRNLRARRAYERAGLVGTVEYLDTDTRDGQRVRSLFLIRERA